uniref:Uncharacterized protein n=1 Tax=Oryza punctata TaxID=4537 RepID=A0A0E0JG71_ORYPU
MNLLNQDSPSQHSSQNSPPTQLPSTFSQSQFSQSPQFTQASPPNFQTFHPFWSSNQLSPIWWFFSKLSRFSAASKLVTICTHKLLSINQNGDRSLKRIARTRGLRFLNQVHIHHHPTKTPRRRPTEKRSALRGRKKAKAKLKGKGKKPTPSPLGDQPCQNFVLFNELVKIESTSSVEINRSNNQIGGSKE